MAIDPDATADGDAPGPDVPPDASWIPRGRARRAARGSRQTVVAGHQTLALTHYGGRYGALDNRCPHQGGPLGEGSIEKGCCAARGTATTTTRSPARRRRGSPTRPPRFPVEVRDDGVYVGCPPSRRTCAPSPTSWSRRWSPGASPTCSAWSGTPTSASPTRCGARRRPGRPHVHRHPPRGRGRVRGVAPTASSPAGRRRASASRARDRPTCSPGSTTPRSTARRCSRSRGQVPSKVLGRGAFQDVDLDRRVRRRRGVLADRAAGLRPRRAHDARAASTRSSSATSRTSCFPTRCRLPTRRRRRRGRPDRSRRRPQIAPPEARRRDAVALHRRAPRPVIVVGHGARFEMDDVLGARRAARRAGAHHVQGQGPDLRPPPARRRRARPQRHAGRELAHERVRPAARVRRLVLEPHRHRAVQADRAGRLRPDGARPLPSGDGPGARRRRRHRAASAGRRCPARPASGSTSGPTSRSAGRSGAPRRRAGSPTTAGHGVSSAAVFDALTRLGARRRGHRRRRRQQRLLVRPLLRVRPPVGADVGLPRLDRVRLPRRDGRVGGGARPPDRRGHRRRRLRPVPRRAHDRGEVRHEHHARAAQQLAARQDHQGAAGRRAATCGRPRCTTRTSPSTPSGAARSASASTSAASSTRHSRGRSPTTARRWSR